jgi:transcriptional repressor NrdR
MQIPLDATFLPGIAGFKPSVTRRAGRKTGACTAGGAGAVLFSPNIVAEIRVRRSRFARRVTPMTFLRAGCSPPLQGSSLFETLQLLQFQVIVRPASAMKCPFCGFENDKVVDSRESKEADSIRRRRECLKCGKRFTTYERIDEIPYMVVKKDGRREKFDRQKVLNGLLRACEKRPVPISKLEQIVNEAESFVIESAERERKTSELGELIMNRLRRYDKVAYVRFASVYLDFKDVKEFMNELKDLVKAKTV